AIVAGEGASEVRDSICGFDCAGDRLGNPGHSEFRWRGCSGNLPETALAGSRATTCALRLHVWGLGEIRRQGIRPERTIRQGDLVSGGCKWISDHHPRDFAGVLSSPADHFDLAVRVVDGGGNVVLRWLGGIFLFCVRAA